MGDVLPPKRQTVVDRLRRRFELYRRHQNACLPRYEQASNVLYDSQRQETLLLKQRFLETKAKKAKNSKSDHHRSNYKDSASDGPKSLPHAKSVKRAAEESTLSTISDCVKEELEKPAKAARAEIASVPSEKTTDQKQQQTAIPSFSVQIVQQFTNTSQVQHSQTIQTNVTVQTLAGPPAKTSEQLQQASPQLAPANQKENQPVLGSISNCSVECKQEKDSGPDLCQCNSQNSTIGESGGDRLSDTFPSLGFTEDSGDDVIHPDILKDLIDDVFTNSADIMKDFNFEDSVGSIKDEEDTAKDIIDLVKGSSPSQLRAFQTDGLTFVNNPASQQQQNGLFESISTSIPSTMTSMTTAAATTPVTTTSTFYTPNQRIPSYGGGSGLSISNGLGLDFKLTEPSPAALTLKQMAEQHQNMQQKQQQQQQQQQQICTTPLTNRPQFNQDSFVNHINPMRSNYLNGANPASIHSNNVTNPKTSNTANMFNGFENMRPYPGIKLINSNSTNNVFKQEDSASGMNVISEDVRSTQRLQKPPAYGATRPLSHYSDAMMHHQTSSHQHNPLRQMGTGQFGANSELSRLQMNQTQQMLIGHNAQQMQSGSPDLKQQSNMIQPHPNLYRGYPPQQNNNPGMFHVSMSQSMSYSTQQFGSHPVLNTNRPPPEYKTHHPNNMNNDNMQVHGFKSNSNYPGNHQRPPNVTITPDGMSSRSRDWRHGIISNQQPLNRVGTIPHQENYGGNLMKESAQQFYPHQYKMTGVHQMNGSNMSPSNHQVMMQQRQRMTVQLRPRSEIEPQVNVASMGPVYNSHHQDLSRHQDGSQINLDFLDNIESSASDLLNFDQVMQGSGAHFPLLDDIEILGK